MYNESDWYLVQCKPRESFRAEIHLRNQGYTCFHPTYPVKKKVAGTVQTVISPLFPCYLFVLLSAHDQWSTIRSTRGVNRLVSFNGMPARVAHSIIAGLQYHCEKLNQNEAEPLLKQGDRVVITEGCFKELEAIVMATKGEDRVILLLNLFNRQQVLDMPIESLKVS